MQLLRAALQPVARLGSKCLCVNSFSRDSGACIGAQALQAQKNLARRPGSSVRVEDAQAGATPSTTISLEVDAFCRSSLAGAYSGESPNTLPKRLIFTDTLLTNGINAGNTNIKLDAIAFSKQCSKPEDPDVLIDFFVELLLALPLSAAKKTSLKSILLSNQASNSYWTIAWTNYIGSQTSADESILRGRLNSVLLEITRLAEHQLA